MTPIMNLPSESSVRTKNSEHQFGTSTPQTTSAPNVCKIFQIDRNRQQIASTPKKHIAIGDLVSKWTKDPEKQTALENARRWLSDDLLKDEAITVRTYRLKQGWSQLQLAQAIGSSQPHIARIEKGTENLTIDTCRRLATALGLDMNTLDLALRHQEAKQAAEIKK